jgi:hypothetical protein
MAAPMKSIFPTLANDNKSANARLYGAATELPMSLIESRPASAVSSRIPPDRVVL